MIPLKSGSSIPFKHLYPQSSAYRGKLQHISSSIIFKYYVFKVDNQKGISIEDLILFRVKNTLKCESTNKRAHKIT